MLAASYESALNFICCVFIYDPLRQRVLNMRSGDATSLLGLAQTLGYPLSEAEMLVGLEVVLRHMMGQNAPSEAELQSLLADGRTNEWLRYRHDDLQHYLALRPM
jgi:hypothetical protein